MTAAERLINYARAWEGYLEKRTPEKLDSMTENAGNNNYTVFAEMYKDYFGENYQGQPWCAVFVSVCFMTVFGEEIAEHFAYCPTGVNNFKRNKRFYTSPVVGDVIFFTNGKRAYHTGIVTGVKNSRVYTVEGNTSAGDGVVENGGGVALKSYSLNNKKILGYGRPNYERIDCTMTADEKRLMESLEKRICELEKKVFELENPMIYNYIDENMPQFARPSVQRALDKDILTGDEKGLNLTYRDLRFITLLDRAGVLGKS